MKLFSRIALLAVAVGLLAVVLSSFPIHRVTAAPDPPAIPVDVKNTHQLVTLVCAAFTSNICTDLERVAVDGTLTPFTAPPTGLVLVVTDFTWKSASVTPGQVAFATLHHQNTSPPHDVAFSAVVATPDGAAVSESQFTSGLQFSDVPVVFVSNTPNEAILLGYLAVAP